MTERPQLRDDLIVSPQQAESGVSSPAGEAGAAGVTYVVKLASSGRYFRLGEREYSIARLFDGRSTLEEIRHRAEEQFQTAIPQEVIEQFAARLERIGLLRDEAAAQAPANGETVAASASEAAKAGGWFQGNPLYLTLKAFDPDRLLTPLAERMKFFFTPHFVVFSLALIAGSAAVMMGQWAQLGASLGQLWRLDTALLVWGTLLLVTVAHEFAHALTCKHFGGQVREMGFLLIYLQPTFYCNISDAWLFPRKSHRLWTTLAGAYFELFLWAVSVLVWRATEPDNFLHVLALVVAATSGVKTLFNFNPLIKLDGYYLLGDWLEIPNLRTRAFAYLRQQWRALWGHEDGDTATPTPRERRIYWIYGLAAAAFSLWLLGWVCFRLGNYLIHQAGGWGFVLFLCFVAAVFQSSAVRGVGVVKQWIGGALARLPGNKRPKLQAVALVLLLVLLLGRAPLNIGGEFRVVPLHNRDINSEVDGVIAAVFYEEGQHITTGNMLVRIDQAENVAELEKIRAELQVKQAQLRMLQAGPRTEEITLQRRDVETAQTKAEYLKQQLAAGEKIQSLKPAKTQASLQKAQEQLSYARGEYERLDRLYKDGLAARQQWEKSRQEMLSAEREAEAVAAELEIVRADELAETRKDYAVAQKEFEQARSRLDLLLAGTRSEQLDSARAEIARLDAQRRYLETQLQRGSVSSPVDGVLATPKMKEKAGQRVRKGDLIAKVLEVDHPTPEILVSEREIDEVQVGQPVAMRARAYSQETYYGRVKAIAPTAEPLPAGTTPQQAGQVPGLFRVIVELDEATPQLKPQMTGNAKISAGWRPIPAILFRRIYQYIRVEFWPVW